MIFPQGLEFVLDVSEEDDLNLLGFMFENLLMIETMIAAGSSDL